MNTDPVTVAYNLLTLTFDDSQQLVNTDLVTVAYKYNLLTLTTC